MGNALEKLIKEECKAVNKVVGVAMTGMPIACTLQGDLPALWTRKIGARSLDKFVKMWLFC
jgi:orotate phosphoribosyltransferase